MSNSLDLLKATGTVVVTDTGEFECKLKLSVFIIVVFIICL